VRSSSPRANAAHWGRAVQTHCASPTPDVIMQANYRTGVMTTSDWGLPSTQDAFAFQKCTDAVMEHLKDSNPRRRLLVSREPHDLSTAT